MKKISPFIALVVGLGISHGGAIGTPSNITLAGTVISNQAIVTGTAGDGSALNVSTEQVDIVVSLVPSILVSPDGDTAFPGQTVTAGPNTPVTLTYTVKNTGNGPQTAQLTLSHSENMPGTLFLDNGDGTLDDADINLGIGGGSFTFGAGDEATIFVKTTAAGPDAAYVNLSGTTLQGAPVDDMNYARIIVSSAIDLTWNRISPNTQIAGSPSTVSINTLLSSDSLVPLTDELKLDAALPDGVTGTYRVYENSSGATAAPAASLQQALANFISLYEGGNLNRDNPLRIEAVFSVPGGYADRTSLRPVFKAWVEPRADSTVTSPDTQATPETVDYEILIGRGVGNVKKQQNVCTQSGTSFTCGTFTADPATVKPCDLIYYRISSYNSGLGSLNTVTLNDTLSSGLWLHWAAAQRFNMTELDSSDFPMSSDMNASVRANTATTEGSWASEQTYPALSDMTVQAATLSGGTPSALDAGRGLYLMVAAQVPGNGCAVPQRSVNITNEPQMLPATRE